MFSFFKKKSPQEKQFKEIEEKLRVAPWPHLRVLGELMPYARKKKIITSSGFPNIPEIVNQMQPVCKELTMIMEDVVMRGKPSNEEIALFIETALTSCTFAGIGVTALWDKDWPTLRDTGFVKMLLKVSTPFNLNENVCRKILKLNDHETKKMESNVDEIVNQVLERMNSQGPLFPIEEASLCLYLFGMIYQMDRLGMH